MDLDSAREQELTTQSVEQAAAALEQVGWRSGYVRTSAKL